MKTKKKIIKSSPRRTAVRKKKGGSNPTRVAVHKKKGGSKKKQSVKTAVLTRYKKNPIISPNTENGWESWQTFNPGVILLNNKVHFLYRAIGEDSLSRFGYAASSDGFHIDERFPHPVYEHRIGQRPAFNVFSYFSGGSWGGAEDPRIVRVDDEDLLYMTYTACDQDLGVALTSIKVTDFLNKNWQWKKPASISPPGQVHKNWVIFPEKIKGSYAILHSLNPQISIDFFDNLEFDGKTYINSFYTQEPKGSHWNWEGRIRGIGPSPLMTKDGWLIFYHAEDRRDLGKYKVGAMLLDLQDPSKILCLAKEPILEPSETYENGGFKSGVVYASGAVIKGGSLLIYYGSADSYICVGWADLDEFLTQLKKEIKPKLKLKQKILKKNR